MDKSKKNNNKNKIWHFWWVGLFGSLLLISIFVFSVNDYGKDMQGYLLKTSTPGEEPINLYFEHLHLIENANDTVSLSFSVDNINISNLGIFSLHFANFPQYLSYTDLVKGDNISSWKTMSTNPDGVAGDFTDNTSPVLTLYKTGASLADGDLVTLNFDIKDDATVDLFEVEIYAKFATVAEVYETEVGEFVIAPDSAYSVSHPDTVELTSTIEIPFALQRTSAATESIVGVTLDVYNIPEFYTVAEDLITAGYVTDDNWITSHGPNSNGFYRIALVTAGSGISTDDVGLFDLVLDLDTGSSVTVPEDPIMIMTSFITTTDTFYSLPTLIQIGGPQIEGSLSDICRLNASGEIVEEPNGIVGLPDLNCMVLQWKQTGASLISNIFNLDSLNIVDIRDLTIMMSQWSPAPAITSISPQTGSTGAQITITGSHFYENLPISKINVYLKDGTTAEELVVDQVTATTIKATIPSGISDGHYNVMIAIDDELYATKDGFTVN